VVRFHSPCVCVEPLRHSRDLEDVIAVVDGRAALVGEIQAARNDVRSYLAHEIAKLCGAREFLDALPGHLPPDRASQERITMVLARLKAIAHFNKNSSSARAGYVGILPERKGHLLPVPLFLSSRRLPTPG
jgi:hypothetical protein